MLLLGFAGLFLLLLMGLLLDFRLFFHLGFLYFLGFGLTSEQRTAFFSGLIFADTAVNASPAVQRYAIIDDLVNGLG